MNEQSLLNALTLYKQKLADAQESAILFQAQCVELTQLKNQLEESINKLQLELDTLRHQPEENNEVLEVLE